MKTLISIVGTTGIGKTRLAIDLAKKFQTEIISCDSRQFFREMKIGTAAPTAEELAEAKHHFIGHLSVKDHYSIGQYEIDALQKTEEIFARRDTAIAVGGSMMYEKALIEGLNDLPESNPENQEKLQKIFNENGLTELRIILQQLDPEYFASVDLANPRRLLRAIDVIWQTGRKYSKLVSIGKKQRAFKVIRIGIMAPREIIYHRINLRVDTMMEAGLLDEARSLLEFRNLIALKTVGYKEIFNYLDGDWPLDFTVEEIKKNSRRFAKRQLTWYRGEDNIHWVNSDTAFSESLSLLKSSHI